MWNDLPPNLRAVFGIALTLGTGVTAAAFALSFFALRAAASNPELQFGRGHEWLFPIALDATLLLFEIILTATSMVRIYDARTGRVKQYPRAVPFLLVAVAAAETLYFNATRVPDHHGLRMIALAVPVASILVTLGLAFLLKMLAALTGADVGIVHADSAYSPTGVPEMFRRGLAQMQPSSGPGSANGHNGHGEAREMGVYGAKRMMVEEYLDLHPGGMNARSVAKALNDNGGNVSERYVKDIIDQRQARR